MTSLGVLDFVSKSLMLAALRTSLIASKIKLFTIVVPIDDEVPIASLTEATFAGYAFAPAATWPTAGVDEDGTPYIVSPVATFTWTGVAPSQTVVGGWVETAVAGTNANVIGLFEQPFNFSGTNLVLNVLIKIREDNLVTLLTLEDLFPD
jgi:hypothetical protein